MQNGTKPPATRFMFMCKLKPCLKNFMGCMKLENGVLASSTLDLFRSLHIFILLVILGQLRGIENDYKLFFRVMQVVYAVPAVVAFVGLEWQYVNWVKAYCYAKVIEFVVCVVRDGILLGSGYCTDFSLKNYVEGDCFTEVDVTYIMIEILLVLYQICLTYSYVNLVTAEEALPMADSGLENHSIEVDVTSQPMGESTHEQ